MRLAVLATMVALLSGLSTAAATELAAPAQAYQFSVQMTKEGRTQDGFQLAVASSLGQDAPLFHGSQQTYLARVERDGDVVKLTPGTVTSGLSVLVTPTQVLESGAVVTRLRMDWSRLDRIDKLAVEDGIEIELPKLTILANFDQTLALVPDAAPVVVGRTTDGSEIAIALRR